VRPALDGAETFTIDSSLGERQGGYVPTQVFK
jgi:hypothetical protein